MTRIVSLISVLSAVAMGQVTINGDIVVVSDPNGAITNLVTGMNGAIIPSPQEQFCRAAFNAARAGGLADEFDGIISFSTSEELTDINNVWQGSPVRSDGSGYARQNSPWMNTYNSSKVGQCVFMGTLGRTRSLFGPPGPEALPSDPDAAWRPSLGIPIPIDSLTGIEMMGHEYGHHWLLGIEFDQMDGRGRQHFIRGFSGEDDMGQGGSPNQHYSHYADSRSVMYGSCITDNGNGSFTVAGCARKYSHIDQYLMGLRAPGEVSPMMVLEDPANPGKGTDTVAMGRNAQPMTVNGYTRHDISAQEIINAMGSRVPAAPGARNCWRVAFVVVLKPGQTTIPQAMLDKVNRYRNRWGPWFNFATDGRGTMDSRIAGNGCVTFGTDAGVPMMDAGMPQVDAGTPDAGSVEPDAGTVEPDAGSMDPDAGMETPDSGTPAGGGAGGGTGGGGGGGVAYVDPGPTRKYVDGCGCGTGSEPLSLLALVGLALVRRRSRR